MNRRVNEIGKPMKMTAIMLHSMTMPRISVRFIGSDLDLRVRGEGLSGPRGPQAFHEFGDALQKQKAARDRDGRPEWPDDRLPRTRARLLVDRPRVDEIVPAREHQDGHGRKEEQDECKAVDGALGFVGEAVPEHVRAHVRALQQSVGTAEHEQGAEGVGRDVERPGGRIVQSVAADDFVDIWKDQNGDEDPGKGDAHMLRRPIDRAYYAQVARRWLRHNPPPKRLIASFPAIPPERCGRVDLSELMRAQQRAFLPPSP